MTIPDVLAANSLVIKPEVVEGGKIYTVYRRGELCKVAMLDSDPAERVASYQAMLTDIYKMRTYLLLACEIATQKLGSFLQLNAFDSGNKDQVICSSLYLSAVTLYGKCFTEPKGRKAQLHASELKKKFSAKQSSTHDRLAYLRHNWTAHGGNSDHESLIPIVAFSQDGAALPIYLFQGTAITPVEEMQDILDLCDPMIELVEELKAKNEANVFKNKDALEVLGELRERASEHVFVADFVQPDPTPSKK